MKDHVPFHSTRVCPACGGIDNYEFRHTISGTYVRVGGCTCSPVSKFVIACELDNPILIAGFVKAFENRTGYKAVVYKRGESFT